MDGYSQAEKVKMADALMQQNGKAPAMHLYVTSSRHTLLAKQLIA